MTAKVRLVLATSITVATALAVCGSSEGRDTPPAHKAAKTKRTSTESVSDSTGSVALSKTEKQMRAPQADDETLPPLFNLPDASKEKMHRCGEKWQVRKMSGNVGDEIWRDFATKCLSAKD